MARLAALVLVSLILQGQSPAPPATGRIAGRVVDAATKAPIADARIRLILAAAGRPMGGPPPEARSDRNGRFVFDQLEPGAYSLQAQKPGFFAAPENALVSRLELKAGAPLDDVTLALQHGGAIAGRVVDLNGEPVVEIRVGVQRASDNGFSPTLMPVGQGVQTNDLGEFRIYGLAPGDYYVQATEAMGPPPSAPMTSRSAPTYFPAARETRDAKAVHVTAGQSASDVNITMGIEMLHQIRGIVVDDKGSPVEGAMVAIMPDRQAAGMPSMSPFNRPKSRSDGSFVLLNVAPGGYTLFASQSMVVGSQGVTSGGGVGAITMGMSGGLVGGGGSVGTFTESRNGVTTMYQYRNDPSKSVHVNVEQADLAGMKIVAAAPPPKP